MVLEKIMKYEQIDVLIPVYNGEKYITITESRKQFLNDNGKIVFEKTKLFLYKEDYEKFVKGLSEAINFAKEGETSDSDFLLDEDSIFDEKINSI